MIIDRENINKQITDRIRLERLRKGYSQEYMSLRLDISQNVYSRIERGVATLGVDRLLQIVDLLEIDMASLLPSYNQEVRKPTFYGLNKFGLT